MTCASHVTTSLVLCRKAPTFHGSIRPVLSKETPICDTIIDIHLMHHTLAISFNTNLFDTNLSRPVNFCMKRPPETLSPIRICHILIRVLSVLALDDGIYSIKCF